MDEDTRKSAKEKVRLARFLPGVARLPAQRAAAATDRGGWMKERLYPDTVLPPRGGQCLAGWSDSLIALITV